jgi:protein-tyrosine phosphatase
VGGVTTRHIAFARLHNFRDLGGYRTADGRTVRWGRLYRSDSLGKLHGAPAEDLDRFLGLGIRTVIDLRYPWEIERRGRVPEQAGLAFHNLSIEHQPYDQAAIAPDADPWRHLADRYAEVAYDGAKEIRQVLDVIAADSGPLVFHCASGKDRTGLIAALVLILLGVDEQDAAADFALTELATERLLAGFRADNPERDRIWPSYGRAPATVMELFLADLTAAHGSVHAYAADRLGVDDALLTALQQRLLTEDRGGGRSEGSGGN